MLANVGVGLVITVLLVVVQRASIKAALPLSWESGGGWWKDKARPLVRVSMCFVFPSLFWHCWLGDTKDIQSVKTFATYPQRFFSRTGGRRKSTLSWKTTIKMEIGGGYNCYIKDCTNEPLYTVSQKTSRLWLWRTWSDYNNFWPKCYWENKKLEAVGIAELLQDRQHAQNP